MAATAALKAFREEYVSTSVYNEEDFNDPDARKVRYDILWSQYENTVYRDIHSWARTYKTRYGLYQYIRSIYNPAYRLGEFWKAHLWGGQLDQNAEEAGALPIVADDEAIRPFIAELWKWSRWSIVKDIVSLHGAIYGDTILRVVDDTELEKVYLEMVYPGLVTDLEKDPFGNIKAYTIEEERLHPVNQSQKVTYRETAEREGQSVVYRTFLNDAPYAWNGEASEWAEPYGFIPMVHIQHNDVGFDWGWSELHPARSKMHELDDLASQLSDQVRKAIHSSGYAFIGASAPSTSPTPSSYSTRRTTEKSSSLGKPELGREEANAYYLSSPDARVEPIILPLEVEGFLMHIQEILKDFERDYPELKFDALRVQGEVSGRALRVARQPVETKVLQRRGNYDDGLKRAVQMALTIGGLRKIFEGINLDSYERGALEFEFADRPVFSNDKFDDYDEELAFWEAAKMAREAGLPLEIFLARNGWSEEDLQELADNPVMQARVGLVENLQ